MQFIWVLCFTYFFLTVALSNYVMSSSMIRSSSVLALGAGVKLNCSTKENDSATWKFTSWNSSTEKPIYSGGDIFHSRRSRYTIEKNISGQHNLIIDSVDLAHAGRYQCIGVQQQSLINYIELIVLGSDPVCAANISETEYVGTEPMNLTIWCRVIYAGKPNPDFKWTKSNEQEDIYAKIIREESLTMISSIMQPLHANDSGVTFRCQITFPNPNNSEEDPNNTYAYTWNYSLYGPMNLSIVEYEDHLECSAEGNPTPIYRWTHVESNKSTDERILELNGIVTSDKDHTFICTASNILSAENTNITVKGVAKDSGVNDDDSDFPLTAIAIGGSLLLLLIIAIIVSCVVHRKILKDDTSERPDVALNTDICAYDEITLIADRSQNFVLEENRSPERSDSRAIADNAVYSEVWKPNVFSGCTNGNSGGTCNISENAPPHQNPTRNGKNLIGADGTQYAELRGVKPPARKGELPKPPAFSRVEVYASIDHNGKAPPPPPNL